MNDLLQFSHRWQEVRGAVSSYQYPQKMDTHFNEWYGQPAVYRWLVKESNGKLVAIYYGECKHLVRRMRGYINPSKGGPNSKGQQTNLRMKQRFDTYLESGLSVSLESLEFRPFNLNGIDINQTKLSNTFVRRLLENYFLASHIDSEVELLNQYSDPETDSVVSKPTKIKNKAIQTSKPGVINSIMEILNQGKELEIGFSANEILEKLVKQYPDRKREGMKVTVNAQLSRLPKEKQFPITKIRQDGHVTYRAT